MSDVPVVEPADAVLRPDRPVRRQVAIIVVVVLCVVAAAIPVAIRMTSGHDARKAPRTAKRVDPRQARLNVTAAVAATIAARNYRISSLMSETAASNSTTQEGLTLQADAIVNVDPLAMVATSDVGGFGKITSWTNGTTEWEQGGGNYGLSAGTGIGPGAPIAGFVSLVETTLGPREAGVAMMGLASPNGHLDLATQTIAAASQVGTTTLNGSQLTEYEVTLDLSRLVNQSGMTPEQIKAATEGFGLLQQAGYTHTTVRLGVDDAGYIREAHTVWSFADGGAVTVDTTYSDYGCAGTVMLPTQTPAPRPTSTCTSPDPAATSPTSNATSTAPTTSTAASEPAIASTTPTAGPTDSANASTDIAYAFGHFFDPKLTADQRIALIQGGPAMRAFIDASFTKYEGQAAAGAVIVDRVTTHGDTADVSFHALEGGVASPANPGQLAGTAVLENGTWKISRTTYCTLSANDGVPCPASP